VATVLFVTDSKAPKPSARLTVAPAISHVGGGLVMQSSF